MAKLKDKVQNALDEGRMLMLGSQVLLGFQYHAAFQPGFDRLTSETRYVSLGSLVLLVITVVLLLTPPAYHQLAEHGEDSERFHSFVTHFAGWSLLPFALAIGIDIYASATTFLSEGASIAIGLVALLVTLFCWFGMEMLRRRSPEHRAQELLTMKEHKPSTREPTPLSARIKHVLTEARVVLPGAQALLGFQLTIMLTESFENLPASSKYIHLASLLLVTFSTVLLMTPAAYHRLVELGEETEHFHRFASRIVLAALAPLALGICSDVYVVARKVTESSQVALVIAGALLLCAYGFWYGLSLARRGSDQQANQQVQKRA